jgi:type II secretory pathway pseudopilin PulG
MDNKQEKGYILVTTLVLLGMLGMLGATSAWKSSVETKVSRLDESSSQALAAANAGLQKQFMEWSLDAGVSVANARDGNRTELVNLARYIANNSLVAQPAIYFSASTPDTIDGFRTNIAGGDIDAYIRATPGIRVFSMTGAGIQVVPNAQWGDPRVPQVAVWATSFVEPASKRDYPYETPNTANQCPRCELVLYALGAHKGVYRMVREKLSSVDSKLRGISAMTNAPKGGNYSDICNNVSSSASANVTPWDPTVTGPGGNGSTVIEVTQATYELNVAPSGVAIASNTVLGIGGKGFRKYDKSKTGASFASTPYLVYSGHGTATGVKVNWADMQHDTTGADLPNNKLPTNLISAPLAGTDAEIKLFKNPQEQLFSMPTYRWAAEQFTCQTLSWPPVANPAQDGLNGNGKFCSKGEALRASLAGMGYVPRAPVTGRLTLAEFQYNVANNIPMFGMVRVMFPAQPSGKSGACGALHVIEQPANAPRGANFNKLVSGSRDNVYDGGTVNVILDRDGDLGPTARLIVYGSLLIDYFADYPIEAAAPGVGIALQYNAIFDPAGGERFLLPIESPDVYLAIEHNIMINPVMPNFVGSDPQAFPTAARRNLGVPQPAVIPSRLADPTGLNVAANNPLAAVGQINMVDLNRIGDPAAGNRVNLASPYDGFFPWAEGLVPRAAGMGLTGTMRLMSRGTLGLVTAMKIIEAGVQPMAMPSGKMRSLLTKPKPRRAAAPVTNSGRESDVLRYHYRLMVESIQHGTTGEAPDNQSWPVAPWPGSLLTNDFYMGQKDQANGNNDGDKLHLMFPTGYPHGWKVALAALDMSANEWNNILSGTVGGDDGIATANGLYVQLTGGCGGGGCPRGLPMSSFEPEFANLANVQTIQNNQRRYFFVTTDAATGYGLIDADWKDIPSMMYSGGLLDMHAHSNMNGIIYSPGPLEWEPGNSTYDTGVHLSYISGSIITGYGQYTKNNNSAHRYIIVFDKQAVDNVNSNALTIILRRFAWQELK